MKPTIAIIIAAYNEQDTIGNVLESAIRWKKAKEIIVVNDGSTDKTENIVKSHSPHVHLVDLKGNQGKGHALALGVERTTSDIIFFTDADVVGLTVSNIEELVRPVRTGDADMVIGLHNFWGIGSFRPYNALSGQRVLWKANLVPFLSYMKAARGGVEFVINRAHKDLRVLSIAQRNVTTVRKIDKWSIQYAMWAYVRQISDFVKGIIIGRFMMG